MNVSDSPGGEGIRGLGSPRSRIGAIHNTAAKTTQTAQKLLPRQQLSAATRARSFTAEDPQSRQVGLRAAEKVLGAMDEPEIRGAESFAALWYADRYGGHPLQAQRESEEDPAPLLNTAIEILDQDESLVGSKEDADLLRKNLADWSRQLQEAKAFRERPFGRTLPRDWSSSRPSAARADDFRNPQYWRDWLDGACVQNAGRQHPGMPSEQDLKVIQSQLPDLLQEVPRGVPIKFALRTEHSSRHAVYVVLEKDSDSSSRPTLTVWNAGWGAIKEIADVEFVRPALRLVFHDEADAARAFLALEAAETLYHPNLPLVKVLTSLTLPSNIQGGVREGSAGTPEILQQALRHGTIHYPKRPVKPQRSGSCAAKGVRLWMKSALTNPEDRTRPGPGAGTGLKAMALLDLAAISMISRPSTLQSVEESRQLRGWLAQITADYRWWKERREWRHLSERLSDEDLAVLLELRRPPHLSAGSRSDSLLAEQHPLQPVDFCVCSSATSAGRAPIPPLQANLRLDRLNEFNRSYAQQDVDALEALWEVIEGWSKNQSSQQVHIDECLDAIRAAGHFEARPGEIACYLSPDSVEFTIWDCALRMNRQVKLLPPATEPLAPSTESLAPSTESVCLRALQLLQGQLCFTPRPGHDSSGWQQVDEVWGLLPIWGPSLKDWPTLTSLDDLAGLQNSLTTELHQLIESWLATRGIRELVPSVTLSKGPAQALKEVAEARALPHRDPRLTELTILRTLVALINRIPKVQARSPSSSEPGPPEARPSPVPLVEPSFAQRQSRATDLTERTRIIRRTLEGSQALALSPSTLEKGVAAGLAMETGGLALYLTTAASSPTPWIIAPRLALWTPPLGSGQPPQPQGDLLAMGGTEAWKTWLEATQLAIGRLPRGSDADQGESAIIQSLRSLGTLANVVLDGLPDPPLDSELQVLHLWQQVLSDACELEPRLVASAARIRLYLEVVERSVNGNFSADLLGGLEMTFASCPWDLNHELASAERFCRWWGLIREQAGIDPAWIVSLRGEANTTVEIDLHHALPLHSTRPSDASEAIRLAMPPPPWTRGNDWVVGRYLRLDDPSGQTTRISADEDRIAVRWSSALGGTRDAFLVRPPQAFAQEAQFEPRERAALRLPDWKVSHTRQNTLQPFPLYPDQILWSGSAPPVSDSDFLMLQSQCAALPGIFQQVRLFTQAPASPQGDAAGNQPSSELQGSPRHAVIDASLLKTGSLQETARWLFSSSGDVIQFADGEQIPVQGRTTWGPLSVVGELNEQVGLTARCCLEQVAIRRDPVRGTIRQEGQELRLHLDNGWVVAPERREELPEALRVVPWGNPADPRTLAIPVVRKGAGAEEELGLLVGKPAGRSNAGAGEMILLKVRPSGDLELDPETGWESLIALLPHLSEYAPTLLPRLLQAFLDARPLLTLQAQYELIHHLLSLLNGAGADLAHLLDLAKLALVKGPEELPRPSLPRGLFSPDPLACHVYQKARATDPPALVAISEEELAALDRVKQALAERQGAALLEAITQLKRASQEAQKAAQKALNRVFEHLPPHDAARIDSRFRFDEAALLNGWFRATQSGSRQSWGVLLSGVFQDSQDALRDALSHLMITTARTRAIVDLFDQVESEFLSSPATGSEPPEASCWSRIQRRVSALEARAATRLPPSQIRQEWLFGILGRPEQSELLEGWYQGAGPARRLLEVRMGGGKTSFINPAIALELAYRNRMEQPAAPRAVLVVVPDALEEDAKRLCFSQGWDLMGCPLPFCGSNTSASRVVSTAKHAAEQGLPLTLTQSAWNFAWLQIVRQCEVAGSYTRTPEQLKMLADATVLIDEADQALNLNEGFNLALSAPRPLPSSLLDALDGLIALAIQRDRDLLAPLDHQDEVDCLVGLAPASWTEERKKRVALALVDRRALQPQDLEPEAVAEAEVLARGAYLITQAQQAAQSLQQGGTAYGPASASSLTAVPYESADWPSNQKFSDPALSALLTLSQAQSPTFWSAERVQALQPLVLQWLSGPMKQRLESVGLTPTIAADAHRLRVSLMQPAHRATRLEVGRLLCQTQVTTSGSVLKMWASGGPLRASHCLAITGTAPAPSQTPTALIGAQPPEPPPLPEHDGISAARLERTDSLRTALAAHAPHILIDPTGLLTATEAAKTAFEMAAELRAKGQLPSYAPVLTWSAGSGNRPPQPLRILSNGVQQEPPSKAVLARLPKVVVYQQAQCRGTDLPPRGAERGLLYLDKVIPLRELQQAAARLRGLQAPADSGIQQSLVIAVGPRLQKLLDRTRDQRTDLQGLDDRQILRILCYEMETTREGSRILLQLEQDLTNLRQAAAAAMLTRRTRVDQIPAILRDSFHEEFRFPTLQQLSQSAGSGPSAREKLLREAALFESELMRLKDSSSEDLDLDPFLHELAVWRQRVALVSDERLATAPVPFMQTQREQTLTQSLATEQQQQLEAESQQSLALLLQANRERSAEQRAQEVLSKSVDWDPQKNQPSGTLLAGVTVADCGLVGFCEYWEQKGGSRHDELIPSSLPISAAALLPMSVPLPIQDPMRLQPLILHTKSSAGWSSAVVAPQETSEMQFTHPGAWATQVEAGALLVTTLTGQAVTGIMASPFEEDPLLLDKLRQDPEWQRHSTQVRVQTRRVRAFFGCPLLDLNAKDLEDELRWLNSEERWQQVWMDMGPAEERAARFELLRERRS
jgi:hypothetical protein